MVSFLSRLAIALAAIKLLMMATALPAVANGPRIDERQIAPAAGRCNNYGNKFVRINQSAVNRVYDWHPGNPTPRVFGTPYCYLSSDPSYPDAIRAAYPIVGSMQWLILYMTTNGRFIGFGFLTGGSV